MPRKDFNVSVSDRKFSPESFKRLFCKNPLDVIERSILRFWDSDLKDDDVARDKILAELWHLSFTFEWAWKALGQLSAMALERNKNQSPILIKFAIHVLKDKHPRPKTKPGQCYGDTTTDFAILTAFQCLTGPCGLKKGVAYETIAEWCVDSSVGEPFKYPKTPDAIRKTVDRTRRRAPFLFGHESR